MEIVNLGILLKEIEIKLIETHNIDPVDVDYFLTMEKVKDQISKDLYWSYLMGSEFWASEIAEIIKLALEEDS